MWTSTLRNKTSQAGPYKGVSNINKHVLFCKILLGKTTGEEILQVIDNFFREHDLQWKTCSHVYHDGAVEMTYIKKASPDSKWMHCIIDREELANKRISPDLSPVMDDAVKIINFIQSRPSQNVWNSVMSAEQIMSSCCFTLTFAGFHLGIHHCDFTGLSCWYISQTQLAQSITLGAKVIHP